MLKSEVYLVIAMQEVLPMSAPPRKMSKPGRMAVVDYGLEPDAWAALKHELIAALDRDEKITDLELSDGTVLSIHSDSDVMLTKVIDGTTYVNAAQLNVQTILHGVREAERMYATGKRGPFIVMSTNDDTHGEQYKLHLRDGSNLSAGQFVEMHQEALSTPGASHFEAMVAHGSHVEHCTPLLFSNIWSADISEYQGSAVTTGRAPEQIQ